MTQSNNKILRLAKPLFFNLKNIDLKYYTTGIGFNFKILKEYLFNLDYCNLCKILNGDTRLRI